MSITVGGENLDYAVADFDDRYIEGTAAQVIYHNLLLFFIVQAVSQRSSRRLVDNTLYIQSRNSSCVLGRLTLCVVEICRYGNYSFLYRLAQIALRICLQLLKNHGGNFLRRILLAVNVNLIVGSHVTLNGRNGLLRIGYRLTFCRLSHQSLAGLCKCHNRRSCAHALRICDYGRLTAHHNGHAAIRRT